jgi:hypothetical protein
VLTGVNLLWKFFLAKKKKKLLVMLASPKLADTVEVRVVF